MDTPSINQSGPRPAASHRLATIRRQRQAIRALLIVTALCFVAIVTLGVYRFADVNDSRAGTPRETDNRLHDCIHNLLGLAGQNRPELYTYKEVWNVCAHEIFSVDQIVDFDIRREKLLRQELDERVLLWMVVAVTLSGVGLAGVQLWMSFTLASSGVEFSQTSEMVTENGRVAFRSSVTGLMILAISLAFFVIYVKWIYTTREVDIPGPVVSAIPGGTISGVGSLDPPARGDLPGSADNPSKDALAGPMRSQAPDPSATRDPAPPLPQAVSGPPR